MLLRSIPRKGATIVENAVVLPVFLLMLIGFIIAALGVFRYQELASLAREGARYASVRGYSYSVATGDSAATPSDVYDNAIKPKAVALDMSRLTYAVTWNPDNRQGNLVTVRVNYQWVPEAFFGGITLSSTSVMPMSY
jgi:Flp pilus assembly protein TadG